MPRRSLERLVDELAPGRVEVISPRDGVARGCQLSLRVKGGGRELFERIQGAGALCDYRNPDVIRVAPVPLYNTFQEVWRFASLLRQATDRA